MAILGAIKSNLINYEFDVFSIGSLREKETPYDNAVVQAMFNIIKTELSTTSFSFSNKHLNC